MITLQIIEFLSLDILQSEQLKIIMLLVQNIEDVLGGYGGNLRLIYK